MFYKDINVRYMNVYVVKCTNDTKLNYTQCLSEEEIDERLKEDEAS